MQIRSILTVMAAGCAAVALTSLAADKEASTDADAPKHDFEEIMKKGMKGDDSLLEKVVGGTASEEEKKTLVEYCESLCQLEPEKGDAASWKKKTSTLLSAAKDAAADKPGSAEKLEKAANCKACHSVHKPKKP